MKMNKKKAIALYSGGLDSILAIKLLLEQEIEVIGLQLTTPFFEYKGSTDHQKYLGIPILIRDMSEDFHKILLKPKHGYGKNKNPCIDCRILMFQKAGEVMNQEKALFIISGEVLGQRPMTQNKRNLLLISEKSGYGKWIVRPLSALLLPETEPERLKIIDRSRLLDIEGRSRKRQLALAENWMIKEFQNPAGGCKLTEPGFAKRINDLLKIKNFSQNDIALLKTGRHFTLQGCIKLVVGRNEDENRKLFSLANREDYLLYSGDCKGPVSLLRFYIDSEGQSFNMNDILELACRITARYCDKGDDADLINITIRNTSCSIMHMKRVPSLSESIIQHYRI